MFAVSMFGASAQGVLSVLTDMKCPLLVNYHNKILKIDTMGMSNFTFY